MQHHPLTDSLNVGSFADSPFLFIESKIVSNLKQIIFLKNCVSKSDNFAQNGQTFRGVA